MLRSGRYFGEGVMTLKGNPIFEKEDMGLFTVISQGLGFTPDEVAARWDANNFAKKYERTIQDRRKRLMNAWVLAYRAGDDEGKAEAMAAIKRFNRKQPTYPIQMKNLRASLRGRLRAANENDAGIRMNRRLYHLRDETKVAM